MAGKSTDILTKAATEFATAKAGDMISKLGEKASGNGKSKGDDNKGFIGKTAQKMGEGKGPVKSMLSGAGEAIKGVFKRKGGNKRPTNIVEDCFIGVTPDVAFAAWTQFEEFASFTKGVENVTRGEETPEEELEEGQHPLEGEETGWTGKIFINRRTWKAKTVDYDPPKRISWTSEGPKGTVDGTITFTAIGDNATLMLFVFEYRSKGPIEWIGNRWRTVGRRIRLDIKHFRRYVMRTEPDELPEPEEADEIPEDAKEESDEGSEDQETDESEESEDEDDEEDEDEDEDESDEDEPDVDFDDPRIQELMEMDIKDLMQLAIDLGYDEDEVEEASEEDLAKSVAYAEENPDEEESGEE